MVLKPTESLFIKPDIFFPAAGISRTTSVFVKLEREQKKKKKEEKEEE